MIGKDHIMYPFLTRMEKIIAMRKFIQRLSGKYVKPYKLEFIAKNGNVFLKEVDARTIKDENKNVVMIIVMVTELRKQ